MRAKLSWTWTNESGPGCLTLKKLKVVTGAQTFTNPSLLIVTGPVVSQEKIQVFCLTAIYFILVANLNQIAVITSPMSHVELN